MFNGISDENGLFTFRAVSPGKYVVLATANPPFSRILRNGVMYLDRSPETLRLLLGARNQGTLVEVMPSALSEVRAVTKSLH